MHTKATVDASRDADGDIPAFLRETGRELVGIYCLLFLLTIVSVPEDLNMKFKSKFNHGFINRGCLYCGILKAL